jgi:sulfur relay (sulfurtransferase) DsrC/TusE family protein
LGFIETEDEVKKILVTIVNLLINSGEVQAMIKHPWKVIEIHNQHYKKFNTNSPNKFLQWKFRGPRSKLPEFQQRSKNVDVITL